MGGRGFCRRLKADAKAEMKRKKVHLVATMAELHDFKMKVGC